MVHGYQYLGKVKKLQEDVSRFLFLRRFLRKHFIIRMSDCLKKRKKIVLTE